MFLYKTLFAWVLFQILNNCLEQRIPAEFLISLWRRNEWPVSGRREEGEGLRSVAWWHEGRLQWGQHW